MEEYDKRKKLKDFYLKIKDCTKCELSKTRTKFVFGGGSAYADIMLVGEAPGKNEDLQGLPFVGRAGKILDELLDSIGSSRNEVFIANVLKCRPPGNRDPGAEEIESCRGYLMEQIEIIDPKIICTMGKFSTQVLLNTNKGITGLRGKILRVNGRLIMPINHPAAALYTPSRMEILRDDFRKVKKLVDSNEDTESFQEDFLNIEAGGKEKSGKQLGLF
ncbi:MAG: uracil-DNA glycosylase [Actinomycetota bacterium]|nr:uracil-DNA glycosylase [Actinomycetota bacterium]